MRAEIDRIAGSDVERGLLLTSLLEAADRVDSTVGLQMAYLKRWAPRAAKPLRAARTGSGRGPGRASRPRRRQRDRRRARRHRPGLPRSALQPALYFANYHVWETIVRNDAPGHYGIACKREDVREQKSAYNSRPHGVGGAGRADRAAADAAGWSSRSRTRASTTWTASARCSPITATWGRWRSTRAATWAPGSASTTPPASAWASISHLRNTEVVFVCGPAAAPSSGRPHRGLTPDRERRREPRCRRSPVSCPNHRRRRAMTAGRRGVAAAVSLLLLSGAVGCAGSGSSAGSSGEGGGGSGRRSACARGRRVSQAVPSAPGTKAATQTHGPSRRAAPTAALDRDQDRPAVDQGQEEQLRQGDRAGQRR